MKRMLKYIYSLLVFIFLFVQTYSQTQKKYGKEKITPYNRQVFVRIGADLSQLILPYTIKIPVYGFEVFADTELKFNFFPTIEAGFNKTNDETDKHSYNMQGYYFRVGMNYNMLNYQHHTDRNIFYVGARYGYSNFYQQAKKVILKNEWGKIETNFDKNTMNTHWFEAILGIRGEIIKNLYLGACVRVKMRFFMSDSENVTPYFIPGFGKGEKAIHPSVSYTISYAIPFKN